MGVARRMFAPFACAGVRQPLRGRVTGGGLPSEHRLVCSSCLAATEQIGVDSGYLDADDLAAVSAIDAERGRIRGGVGRRARRREEWHLEPDGRLAGARRSAPQVTHRRRLHPPVFSWPFLASRA